MANYLAAAPSKKDSHKVYTCMDTYQNIIIIVFLYLHGLDGSYECTV